MDSLHAKKPERWGTRIGVILAVTGGAVGLGSFLRFPGLARSHNEIGSSAGQSDTWIISFSSRPSW